MHQRNPPRDHQFEEWDSQSDQGDHHKGQMDWQKAQHYLERAIREVAPFHSRQRNSSNDSSLAVYDQSPQQEKTVFLSSLLRQLQQFQQEQTEDTNHFRMTASEEAEQFGGRPQSQSDNTEAGWSVTSGSQPRSSRSEPSISGWKSSGGVVCLPYYISPPRDADEATSAVSTGVKPNRSKFVGWAPPMPEAAKQKGDPKRSGEAKFAQPGQCKHLSQSQRSIPSQGGPGGRTTRGANSVPGEPCSGPETMKAQLQALQQEDPSKVFIVRRINKLGFSSADQLKSHFDRYGEVKGVFVSHSRVKPMRQLGDWRLLEPHWRLRAAGVGFVVMATPQATTKILSEGPEIVVNGITVSAHPFRRRSCDLDTSKASDSDHSDVHSEDVSVDEVGFGELRDGDGRGEQR